MNQMQLKLDPLLSRRHIAYMSKATLFAQTVVPVYLELCQERGNKKVGLFVRPASQHVHVFHMNLSTHPRTRWWPRWGLVRGLRLIFIRRIEGRRHSMYGLHEPACILSLDPSMRRRLQSLMLKFSHIFNIG